MKHEPLLPKARRHLFWDNTALSHGIIAAIVYNHIPRQGTVSLSNLLEVCPYFRQETVEAALLCLSEAHPGIKGAVYPLIICKAKNNFVRHWYTGCHGGALRWFDPILAEEVGVVAACVNWALNEVKWEFNYLGRLWLELYFSKQEIQNALVRLKERPDKSVTRCAENNHKREATVGFIAEFLSPSNGKVCNLVDILRQYLESSDASISNYIRGLNYQDFLKTSYWLTIANHVRERHGHRCSLCPEKGFHIHHRTYEHHGYEIEYMDTDLTCLCADCHKKFHRPFGSTGE